MGKKVNMRRMLRRTARGEEVEGGVRYFVSEEEAEEVGVTSSLCRPLRLSRDRHSNWIAEAGISFSCSFRLGGLSAAGFSWGSTGAVDVGGCSASEGCCDCSGLCDDGAVSAMGAGFSEELGLGRRELVGSRRARVGLRKEKGPRVCLSLRAKAGSDRRGSREGRWNARLRGIVEGSCSCFLLMHCDVMTDGFG